MRQHYPEVLPFPSLENPVLKCRTDRNQFLIARQRLFSVIFTLFVLTGGSAFFMRFFFLHGVCSESRGKRRTSRETAAGGKKRIALSAISQGNPLLKSVKVFYSVNNRSVFFFYFFEKFARSVGFSRSQNFGEFCRRGIQVVKTEVQA